MDRNEGNQRKAVFIVIVAGDLSLLFVCKYLAFVVENLDRLPAVNIPVPEIVLPVGISFFTFQALPYVTDAFRTPGSAEKSLVNVALYISIFPQLIAGPIVRYGDVSEKIRCRRRDPDLFSWGVYRFIQGLGKKAIIANTVASAADTVFKVNSSGIYMGGAAELTPGLAWVGAVAFAIQIYFDFSGYSDMAIGLGAMLGFRFQENFNYPYASDSLTQYWRRWLWKNFFQKEGRRTETEWTQQQQYSSKILRHEEVGPPLLHHPGDARGLGDIQIRHTGTGRSLPALHGGLFQPFMYYRRKSRWCQCCGKCYGDR